MRSVVRRCPRLVLDFQRPLYALARQLPRPSRVPAVQVLLEKILLLHIEESTAVELQGLHPIRDNGFQLWLPDGDGGAIISCSRELRDYDDVCDLRRPRHRNHIQLVFRRRLTRSLLLCLDLAFNSVLREVHTVCVRLDTLRDQRLERFVNIPLERMRGKIGLSTYFQDECVRLVLSDVLFQRRRLDFLVPPE